MKTILLILFIFSIFSFAEDYPYWYPEESHQPYWHMGASAGSQLTSYAVFRHWFKWSEGASLLLSIPAGMVPGLGKEIFDQCTNGYFNMDDIAYNATGVLSGATLVLIYNFYF